MHHFLHIFFHRFKMYSQPHNYLITTSTTFYLNCPHLFSKYFSYYRHPKFFALIISIPQLDSTEKIEYQHMSEVKCYSFVYCLQLLTLHFISNMVKVFYLDKHIPSSRLIGYETLITGFFHIASCALPV